MQNQKLKPRQLHTCRNLAQLGVRDFLRLIQRLIRRGQNHILKQLYITWTQRCWINPDRGDRPIAPGSDFDRTATTGGFDSPHSELRLHLLHLLLHSRRLFLELSNVEHKENRVSMTQIGSAADFYDLPFENLQRLLDQRIILEIVLVERNWRGKFLFRHRSRSRRFGSSRRTFRCWGDIGS